MKTWFVILLGLVALSACASTVQQPAEEIYQQRQGLQQIWQGYDPVARGVGYYHANDGHVVLALDTSTAPANFSQLSPGIWRSDEPFPRLRSAFYINTTLNDTRATVLRYPQQNRNPFNILFHEDFHGYQQDNFDRDNGSSSTLSRFDTGSMSINTLVAAVRRERALLTAALDAEDGEKREQFLLQYAGLRLWREAQLPAESVEIERGIETSEGTANWVGYRAEQILLGYSNEALIREFKLDLGADYENRNESRSMRLLSARVYSTGTALSEILSIVSEHQWQALVEQESIALFDILLEAYEWPQEWLETVGEQFVATEAFAQSIQQASTLSWPEDEDAALARVEREHNWKLKVYLTQITSAGFSAGPGSIVPLSDTVLLLNPVGQFGIESDSLSVDIRNLTIIRQGGPVDSDQDGDRAPMTVFLNRVGSSLRCADGERSCEGSTSSISQRGLRIESETPFRYQLERLNQ